MYEKLVQKLRRIFPDGYVGVLPEIDSPASTPDAIFTKIYIHHPKDGKPFHFTCETQAQAWIYVHSLQKEMSPEALIKYGGFYA